MIPRARSLTGPIAAAHAPAVLPLRARPLASRRCSLHLPVRTAPADGGAARSLQLAFDFGGATPRAYPTSVEVLAPVPVVRDAEPSAEARLAQVTSLVAGSAGIPLELVLTDNRRTMISSRRHGSGLFVRLHRMFLHAGPTVLAALGRYLSRRDARASRLVGEFIESHRNLVRPAPPRALRTNGHHHDLGALLAEVSDAEFGGPLDGVNITWGRKGPARRRKRSIRLGTYSRDELLVRVHPALDAAWVPRFFVRYIVFHELLHHVEREVERNGRTEFHTPAFRAREQRYGDYARALAWEKENLARLLRSA